MGQLSAAQIYQDLLNAGYSRQSALIQTAIALAESGGNDAALGDVSLEDAQWGPSYGVFQIRTLKADYGSGRDRDVSYLSASDANQAKAAFDISHGGTDFSAWSTYTSGKYQQFLGQAQGVASTVEVSDGSPSPFPTFGPAWLPWNLPSDLGNKAAGGVSDAVDQGLAGARTVVIEGAFVVLGLGLLALGAFRTVKRKGGT